jgi:hypothetical protein
MATALGVASALASAQQAELCYGNAQSASAAPPTNATVFHCPSQGDKTLPQLAQAGWRIVKLTPVASSGGVKDQLLLRQDDRLFRHGFE